MRFRAKLYHGIRLTLIMDVQCFIWKENLIKKNWYLTEQMARRELHGAGPMVDPSTDRRADEPKEELLNRALQMDSRHISTYIYIYY